MRLPLLCILAIASLLTFRAAHAQFGVAWKYSPRIVVIAQQADDPRFALVEEAVAYWNRTLEALGSGFRLGAIERLVQTPPDDALQGLSNQVLGIGPRNGLPSSLYDMPGDLRIFLGNSNFVSFAGPFDRNDKRVVGIRGMRAQPMGLPNVARNVITHEIGHSIGLGHNTDPAALMCGRPSDCRPELFESQEPKVFPLTDAEKQKLLELYPRDWKPGR